MGSVEGGVMDGLNQFGGPRWTPAEKAIARKVYDQALQGELAAVIEETKRRAAALQTPAEVWELEEYLGKRRREIDGLFDYRYSVLLLVFVQLVYRGKVKMDELAGLSDDKLEHIRSALAFADR